MTGVLRQSTAISVTRLAGNIGAEIRGVDAGKPVDPETVAAIRAALLEHKVVFLRNQSLTYESQVAFAQQFGELTRGHPIYSAPTERVHLREIDAAQGTRANYWHTDLTFVDRPPAIAMLHIVILPPVGGDTMWANGVTAYASMPQELRELADRLRIVHSNDSDYTDATVAARLEFTSTIYEAEHPAVAVHPETGERALIVGGFARRVVGMTPTASRHLLQILQEYATHPEHTVRWRWQPGDLAIWDNRATQHYAIFDYGTQRRRGERVTVTGDPLIGVDGRPSTMLRGDVAAYYSVQ